jgi:FMN reductase
MTRRTLAVISAGLSQPSSTRLLADRLAAATELAVREEGAEPDVHQVELRDYAHDLMNNLLTHVPSKALDTMIRAVLRADGLVVVTPIFNASYSGLLKVFFDVLEADSLAGKPVLIAATGGTARHSLALDHALRPLLAYLQAVVVPTGVFAASEDWGTGEGGAGLALAARVDQAAHELAALMRDRTPDVAPDPFEDPTPFEQMLQGS